MQASRGHQITFYNIVPKSEFASFKKKKIVLLTLNNKYLSIIKLGPKFPGKSVTLDGKDCENKCVFINERKNA